MWDLTIHLFGGQRSCWHTTRCLALIPFVMAQVHCYLILSSLGFPCNAFPQGFKTRLLERGFHILIRKCFVEVGLVELLSIISTQTSKLPNPQMHEFSKSPTLFFPTVSPFLLFSFCSFYLFCCFFFFKYDSLFSFITISSTIYVSYYFPFLL